MKLVKSFILLAIALFNINLFADEIWELEYSPNNGRTQRAVLTKISDAPERKYHINLENWTGEGRLFINEQRTHFYYYAKLTSPDGAENHYFLYGELDGDSLGKAYLKHIKDSVEFPLIGTITRDSKKAGK